MLQAILTTVASSVILAILGAATRQGRQLLRNLWTGRQRQPEPLPLNTDPWPVHLPPDCDGPNARFVIVCAPNERLHSSSFDMSAAVQFARQSLQFVGEPAYSGVKDGVRLESKKDGGSFNDYVWVCVNGKLQLSVTVPVEANADGRRCLSLLKLLEPLSIVAEAVASAEYRKLYGLPGRTKRRRINWLLGVSIYSRAEAMMSVPTWNDLIFPGEPAPRMVTDRPPFCPVGGYAFPELREWRADQSLADLLRIFLRSFLAENGYHDFEPAVEETVHVFLGRRETGS
jgi:hypothetical protein